MNSYFTLQTNEINLLYLNNFLSNIKYGAYVSFIGKVRNSNRKKTVQFLNYEGDLFLAENEFKKIVNETKKKFYIKELHCVHRTGKLSIGDTAIWVCAIAMHRKDAFRACQYAVAEIKNRLPIWKQEIYQDNITTWIDEEHRDTHITKNDKKIYYYRQMRLEEVGPSGQLKLNKAKILVIGAGGLGCTAIQYLSAAGIGTLGICDKDRVEISNIHRQMIYKLSDQGKSKAEIAGSFIKKRNPFISIKIYNTFISPINIKPLFNNYDLILDCTDNFSTKYLINDASFLLNKPSIRASIYKFDGQLDFYKPKSIGSCLRCIWKDIPVNECIKSCADVGVLGFVPGLIGIYQASEAIKYILGLHHLQPGYTLFINLLSNKNTFVFQKKYKFCTLCGISPTILDLNKTYYTKNNKLFNIKTLSLKKNTNTSILYNKLPLF